MRKTPHREIPLSRLTWAKVTAALHYNRRTGIFTWKIGQRKGRQAGSLDAQGYRRIQLFGKMILAHRLAWFIVHRKWPKHEIDHRHRKRDDNRLAKLREATPGQNSRNNPGWPVTKSGVKGAYKHPHGRWYSRIRVAGRDIYLGSHATKRQAAAAYARASRKYHGRFGLPAMKKIAA